MANTKSSKKSCLISKKNRKYNMSYRSMLRTFIKRVYSKIKISDKMQALSAFTSLQKIIDKQTRKGLIHKNKASRCKARIYSKIKSISSISKNN